MPDFVCDVGVECRLVAAGSTACEWSSRSVRHDIGCRKEQVSVPTGLLLTTGGDQEVRTTHCSSTS